MLANALAQRARYGRAVELLEGLPLISLPSPWREEALWTLYVAQRATLDEEGFRATLDLLRGLDGEDAERAEREWQQLRRGP